MHRIWDTQIIERYSNDEGQWFQELRPRINGSGFDLRTDRKTLVDWASESLEIAKLVYRMPGGYGRLLRLGTELDQGYYRFVLPIIRQQLARAGHRVAWMLNEVFK